MSSRAHSAVTILMSVLLVSCSKPDGSAATKSANVSSPDTEWLLEGNESDNTFYSALSDINDKNVKELGLAWAAELPTLDGAIGTPLVADGVIYQSSSFSRVVANDLRTGKLLWDFRPEIHYTGKGVRRYGIVNRGVALYQDKVYVNTGDCRLLAIDRKSGKQLWASAVCEENEELTITAMPHVGDGMVFVGTSNGDHGTSRCHLSAFDAATGQKKWRFYTLPGDPKEDELSSDPQAMRRAAETWGEGYTPSGGCPWNSVVYDSKLDLLFVGTGGPAPLIPDQRGTKRGSELYSNSIVALEPRTGKYVWHYQVTPNDGANFEAIESITVADLEIDGDMRRVVMQAPKNGFFFVLDGKTGRFISAQHYVPVNWTSGYDASGKAEWRSDAQYWTLPSKRASLLPTSMGAHGIQPMSFSPLTRLAYIPAVEMAHDWWVAPEGYANTDLTLHANTARTPLVAWDPIAQKERWRVDRPLPLNGGVLSTGGNLVFQGLGSGEIEAYQADTGALLWSFQTNAGIAAAPITARVDGRQLLIVSVGNGASLMTLRGWRPFWNAPVRNATPRLLAFELGGTASLPPVPPVPPLTKPLMARPTPEAIGRGATLYAQSCEGCHGTGLLAVRGAVPDLRRSPMPAAFEAFKAVVIDGARVSGGMPKFDELDVDALKQIQAYIIQRSWDSFEAQERGTELGPDM